MSRSRGFCVFLVCMTLLEPAGLEFTKCHSLGGATFLPFAIDFLKYFHGSMLPAEAIAVPHGQYLSMSKA